MLKILKKIFHKKEVYDYLTDEDKKKYEDICMGVPIGGFNETVEFLNKLTEIKIREGIK